MLRASALSATLFSTLILQTAGHTVRSKRKHFNRPRSISLLSFSLRGCLVKTRTGFPIVSRTELGLPLFLVLLLQSDWLAPYCFFTFLAGAHNYLAGIQNYFFTFKTMTTVHPCLPLGGWYCTISFLFSSVLPNTAGHAGPARSLLRRAWPPSR